jgi:hypothetical protein
MAASFAIAARERGFKPRQREAAVERAVRTYREAMREFASLGNLEVWYSRLDVEEAIQEVTQEEAAGVSAAEVARLKKGVAKAQSKDSLRALDRLTEEVDGQIRFRSEPPILVPGEQLVPAADGRPILEMLKGVVATYRESLGPEMRVLFDSYEFREIARKVVGVGSVGTRAWVILMTGPGDRDPLFLQAKEAEASVMEPYVGASEWPNHGQRVVEGQRLMQAASDIFLGWCGATGLDGRERDFYVRQLWDWKRSADVERLSPSGLEVYARICGWTLARAHARSGNRFAIASYLGGGDSFDRAICSFAADYTEQNLKDHQGLLDAIDSGRVTAEDA